MKTLCFGVMGLALSGCIHIHWKADVAEPETAARIQFPDWGQDTATVPGPQLKALQIAMDDFRPPGSGQASSDEALVRCLQKIENYDAWLKRGEGMTFVHFTPKEDERCGLAPTSVDLGASYAIDDEGVILKRH